MPTTRGNVHHALATPVQVRVRPITLALAAAVIAVVLALSVALAMSDEGAGDASGYTKSVRVAPSVQSVPSLSERNQQPGLNGPGMRP